LDADFIVRVSSDAPFIDPGFVDHLVTAIIAQEGDYILMEDGAQTAHEGVDPFSRRALDKLMMDAHDDPVAREHVTGYFKLHPEFVPIARAPAYPALARKAGRLTIDTGRSGLHKRCMRGWMRRPVKPRSGICCCF
jgi:spore coat polysaccharide biosynthesis protein SpsF